MNTNKTTPTELSPEDFISLLAEPRQSEIRQLVTLMAQITNEIPVMWGPSIIGFGTQHYRYETGRSGSMPRLSLSPRKAAITLYFPEGFEQYDELLERVGKHTRSISCLYVKKLSDINMSVLSQLLKTSYDHGGSPKSKPVSVADYVAAVPPTSKSHFSALRQLVIDTYPEAKEVLSYGIIGYRTDTKRPRVFISGWRDHVAIYPVPKNAALQTKLKPYQRGKGTLWFSLKEPLPKSLIRDTIRTLTTE